MLPGSTMSPDTPIPPPPLTPKAKNELVLVRRRALAVLAICIALGISSIIGLALWTLATSESLSTIRAVVCGQHVLPISGEPTIQAKEASRIKDLCGVRVAKGPRGQVGLIGPVGAPGPPGPRGPQGLPGKAGANAKGAAGPSGAPGAKGPPGAAGPRGPAGGSGGILGGGVGPRGPAGPAGPRGPTGPAGPQGIRGLTGPEGPTGPAGIAPAVGTIVNEVCARLTLC